MVLDFFWDNLDYDSRTQDTKKCQLFQRGVGGKLGKILLKASGSVVLV